MSDRALTGPGAEPSDPGPAAEWNLQDQESEAEQREYRREQAAGGVAEADRELLQDRRRERRVPHHLQYAELGQQMQRDQQRAACDRGPQLRQYDSKYRAKAGRTE